MYTVVGQRPCCTRQPIRLQTTCRGVPGAEMPLAATLVRAAVLLTPRSTSGCAFAGPTASGSTARAQRIRTAATTVDIPVSELQNLCQNALRTLGYSDDEANKLREVRASHLLTLATAGAR